jgi:alanyl-tRNA synthetase
MTERLYYTEPYQTDFDATVVSCTPHGERFAIVLDRSTFYPTSGGQPFDEGVLGSSRVVDVADGDDGTIVHITDGPLTVGDRVRGEINWVRRFDHMQQHTGQHVLSAAFDRLSAVRTESFHLGKEASSIDLAREVTTREVAAVEDEANRIVWEDREVRIRFADEEEAMGLPLRKESLRRGPLRLIEVEAFDLSACGGTHVTRTGGIGVIAITSWEKFRGGSRVEFLSGGRALARFRQWRDALASTVRHLSVHPSELAAAVERLQADTRTLQKTIRGQQEQLASHEARSLVTRADRIDTRLVLIEALEGWDAGALKTLAVAAITSTPALAVALFSRGTPAVVVVAAGTESGVDAAAVLKTLTSRFGGKGGGRRELAQGGGFTATIDELVTATRTLLSN